MKNNNLLLTLFYCLFFLSCFQNDSKNSDETSILKLKETEFLSQEMLIKYREEAKTIEFPYKKFGLDDSLKFNKVIAYEFDGSSVRVDEYDDDESSVLINETNFSKRIKKQRKLDYNEIEMLLSIFTSEKYFGGLSALCFDPKLSFVFYHNSKVVNVIDICLNCNDFHLRRDFPPHKAFVSEMDIENWESVESFNKKGVQGITNLCKNLDFEYANFEIEEGYFE